MKNNDKDVKVKLNKNTVIILISLFCVSVMSITYLMSFLIVMISPKQDITELQVSYTNQTNGETKDTEKNNVSEGQDTAPSDPSATTAFIADLSEYEKYMNPEGDEYLTIINRENMLDPDYVPGDLVDVASTRNDGRATQKMRKYAAKALEALFIEAEANGMTYVNPDSGVALSVTSAYRSYEYQAQRLAEETANKGSEEAALKVVQYPGASEHQSGLCCDMHNMSSAVTAFESQEAAEWLAENCHKFGFILRYPEDKTDITGISYEPWHFRFVGRYHATKMYELGMCLEEYWEYLGK